MCLCLREVDLCVLEGFVLFCFMSSSNPVTPQDLLVKGEQEVQDLLVVPVTPVVPADLEFQEPWVRPDPLDIVTRTLV